RQDPLWLEFNSLNGTARRGLLKFGTTAEQLARKKRVPAESDTIWSSEASNQNPLSKSPGRVEAPDSRCRRTAIEEEMTASGGEQDAELVATDCLDPTDDPSSSNLT